MRICELEKYFVLMGLRQRNQKTFLGFEQFSKKFWVFEGFEGFESFEYF
jgi:hypothetical protein